jgi:hypothetical protein
VSDRSALLRGVAERVTAVLPGHVEDVVLTGSTSRESADDLSDVELLAISEVLPEELPLDELQTWSTGIEGAHWFGGTFESEYVELVWWTPSYVEERIAGLAAGKFGDHQRLRTAEAIVHGIPLRGERHGDWCARLETYPEGLAAAIVDDVADTWIEPIRSQTSLLRPGDSLVLAERLVEDAQRLLQAVFAVNETWEPGWKRLQSRLEPLALKPERLAEHLDTAIRSLDLQAMRALAAEALALAPQTEKTRRARELLLEPL